MEADAGDTLDGFNGKTDKGHGVHEPYDYLQTVVELLRSLGDWEMQESKPEGWSGEYMTGNVRNAVKKTYNRLISPTSEGMPTMVGVEALYVAENDVEGFHATGPWFHAEPLGQSGSPRDGPAPPHHGHSSFPLYKLKKARKSPQ